MRIARLTNVVGSDFGSKNFLYELIRSACDLGHIELRSSATSEKDYLLLEDVVELLPKLATSGRHACYNVGAGQNIAHSEIVEAIASCTGARWRVADNAPTTTSRRVDIARAKAEFGFGPRPVLAYLPALIEAYRTHE